MKKDNENKDNSNNEIYFINDEKGAWELYIAEQEISAFCENFVAVLHASRCGQEDYPFPFLLNKSEKVGLDERNKIYELRDKIIDKMRNSVYISEKIYQSNLQRLAKELVSIFGIPKMTPIMEADGFFYRIFIRQLDELTGKDPKEYTKI